MAPKPKEKFDDMMLDMETLDTSASAVILSIGAVRFNEKNIADDAFYRVITLQSNLDEHRTISQSTLGWWMKQDAKAKAVFEAPNQVTLGLALAEFRTWGGTPLEWDNTRVWANAPDFDCTIMKHAYGQQGEPWKFWNTRCYRTIKNLQAARNVPKPANAGAHNALFDAIAQAQHLQALWAAGVGK